MKRGCKTRAAKMMKLFLRFKDTLVRNRIYFGHLGLLILFLLGLMNLLYILGFREPTDGVDWQPDEQGQLVAEGFTLEDFHENVQQGDILLEINDNVIDDLGSYKNFLHEAVISAHYLYVMVRDDETVEYWIPIVGIKDPSHRQYFPKAVAGFLYLVFLFLISGRKSGYGGRWSMTLFCLAVFFLFAFHRTNRFSPLDWMAYFIDNMGIALLPSALAGLLFSHVLARTRILPFVQALHWAPTLLLLFVHPFFLLRYTQEVGAMSQEPARAFLETLEYLQAMWGGGLIVTALILAAVIGELRFKKGNFTLIWLVSWSPFALTLLEAPLPMLEPVSALTPILLPIVLLANWSNRGSLYLGEIGKKTILYATVVFVLTTGYALFIIIFQMLLGDKISSAAHETILGIAILFAVLTYAPAKHYAGEWVDRMIYGKRLTSIRNLTDFSDMNRADIRIDDFLINTSERIEAAFEVEKSTVFKVGETPRIFYSVSPDGQRETLVFPTVPEALLEGQLLRGHSAKAQTPDTGENPFAPNDFICPIRVSGELSALLVFSLAGNNPRLSSEESRLLTSLLNQCNVLMENMELYQSVTQKAISINQLKEYNENIIESSRVGILTTDEMDKAVSFNSALVELTGLERDEIMGMSFDTLFVEEKMDNKLQVATGWIMEGRYLNAAGASYLLEVQKNPLKTKENQTYGNLYLVEDIREKKEFDEKLMQQEKLASIGMLAAGVAHEINTPLTGIASYAQMLAAVPMDDDDKELVDLIQGQSRRAARIVSELLNFSRKGDQPKGPVDLASVLDQTLRFLGHQVTKRKVMVTVNEPTEPAMINGYANQIQQVFVNLIVNAMDAMPEGGTLTITFTQKHRSIEMIFQDSGQGMDEDTRKHIFDPFFTTKDVGKGTGLGLAVVYNILQDHEANAEVRSRKGKGTTFRLIFPKANQPNNLKRSLDHLSRAN